MYYLKRLCCVCMENNKILINSTNLNKNIIYFYYSCIVKDLGLEKTPVYFCMKCFITIKGYYNFTNQCIRSKKILSDYIDELNSVNTYNDDLGDFNITVSLTDVDPYNQIKGTVIATTTNENEENPFVFIKQEKSEENDENYDSYENHGSYENSQQNYEDYGIEYNCNGDANATENGTDHLNEPEGNIDELIKDGKINQVKIKKINSDTESKPVVVSKPTKIIRKKLKKGLRFTDTSHRCKICGNEYRGAKYLEIHMMIHTGERPFSCDICMKTFRQLPHLTQHRMIHFDLRPHQCHLCKKRFRQAAHLKSHIMLHSNARNYKCEICYKTYRSSANLNSHKKSHFKQKQKQYNVHYTEIPT